MRRASHKRATRQLEAVFQALQGDPTHPFADEIYRRVRKKLPRISLATVYRNLQRLVEDGKIRTSFWGSGSPAMTQKPTIMITLSVRAVADNRSLS